MKTKTKIYEELMKKCLRLAQKAKGKTAPNPMVGAIIYDEEKNEIIASGYHKKYGKAHAEVNAINNAIKARKNPAGKTIVVSLEPCSHFGKTPPCADLIIKSGLKKVIISHPDPNPLVSGRGIEILKNAGIEVITGILDKDAKELNKVFIKNILTKKPYIMLKTATTLDGKIALSNGKSKWITNEKAREEVQKLRSEYQAIMSASGTILKDNPLLNVRIKGRKSPTRIIFDPNNKISLDYNVFNEDGCRIILINNSKIKTPEYIEKISFEGDFNKLFKTLFEKEIYSIMVEAGNGLNSELLKSNEIDEINQFVAPKIFCSGLNFVSGIEYNEISECIYLDDIKIKKIEDNFLINGKIKKTKEEL